MTAEEIEAIEARRTLEGCNCQECADVRALLDEVKRLRGIEPADLNRKIETYLDTKLGELEADKARLDWLSSCVLTVQDFENERGFNWEGQATGFREAIDAARQEVGKSNG